MICQVRFSVQTICKNCLKFESFTADGSGLLKINPHREQSRLVAQGALVACQSCVPLALHVSGGTDKPSCRQALPDTRHSRGGNHPIRRFQDHRLHSLGTTSMLETDNRERSGFSCLPVIAHCNLILLMMRRMNVSVCWTPGIRNMATGVWGKSAGTSG